MSSDQSGKKNLPDQDQLERAFEYYPRLRKVKEYVEEHLAEPITLEEAARVATLEKKYFSKVFSSRVGIPFTQWLHDLRIEEAKKLLKSENLPISEVAARTGYNNTRTFRRGFKKRTNMTPSAYRQARVDHDLG